MPVETKYNTSHPAGANAQARIASREKGSGLPSAASVTKQGDGPTRTITSIHPLGSHGGTGKETKR
jgi:hypothetical protein